MNATARPRSQYGRQAAVASGHPLATLAARDCLLEGGSLADAMIAASAVLAVVLPHASSLGGCAMMVGLDASRSEVLALNGSGRAPLAAAPEQFTGGMPQRGVRAAVVPTLVRLWARAHERLGRLPWPRLLAPAIALAADGTAVAEELARNLAAADAKVRGQPGFAQALMREGRTLAAGEALMQPALAQVLQAVAAHGEAGFYEGAAADSLVRFSQAHGGLFSAEDFARAQADWVTPWSGTAAGRTVHVMPPNSVGVLMLQQLAQWDAAGRAQGEAAMPAAIEAAIAAIAAGRDRIGDPGRMPVTPADFGLVPPSYSAALQAPFQAARAGVGDTTGFVAMDAHGNALALLQSVFQPCGSGAVDPGTGILLNNRMFDFSPQPGSVNAVGPGVRPSHTLNPWLVQQGGQVLAAGVSPGGVSQTTTGLQIVCGLLDAVAPPSLGALVARPRWSLSRDGAVLLEPGIAPAVAETLRARGHTVEENSLHEFYFGSAKLVRRTDHGFLEAAADHRRQAAALAW
jgi:gamma-glutamyltranspeptidase/glutathione hydrolase